MYEKLENRPAGAVTSLHLFGRRTVVDSSDIAGAPAGAVVLDHKADTREWLFALPKGDLVDLIVWQERNNESAITSLNAYEFSWAGVLLGGGVVVVALQSKLRFIDRNRGSVFTELSHESEVQGLRSCGEVLVVWSANKIQLVNVSTPISPQIIRTLPVGDYIDYVEILSSSLVVFCRDGLILLDKGDRKKPLESVSVLGINGRCLASVGMDERIRSIWSDGTFLELNDDLHETAKFRVLDERVYRAAFSDDGSFFGTWDGEYVSLFRIHLSLLQNRGPEADFFA